MRHDINQVWQDLLLAVRGQSEDAAEFLRQNATMRLDYEQQEVMIAGSVSVRDYLRRNQYVNGLLERAAEGVLGWNRVLYERFDYPATLDPSGYLFYIEVISTIEEEEDEEQAQQQTAPSSPFDEIRMVMEDGSERWSARALMELLEYSSWQKFKAAIDRAIETFKSSGGEPSDHFNLKVKMVDIGKGGRRKQPDFLLSRQACYVIAMNGNPSRPMIGKAQLYFATQTRRMELLDQLREDSRRVRLRKEISEHNNKLLEAARDAGVITSHDFAIFQNYGYDGLYDGEHADDIRRRKGLKRNESPYNAMGFDEMAANVFRLSLAEQRLRKEKPTYKEAANDIHLNAGRAVRRTIIEQGGTLPEKMPTPDHITKAERRLQGADLSEIELLDSPEQPGF